LDLVDRFRKFALRQKDRRFRPGIHHYHVGTKLLHAPGQFFALGVGRDKIEQIQIALSIANYTGVIINLKQAQVSVIILNAFLLKFGNLFGIQFVGVALSHGMGSLELVIGEERFAIVGANAVRTAG